MAEFHPTAVVETRSFAPDVVVDAYAVVGPEVTVGRNVRIHAGAVIMGFVDIGAGTVIFPGAVIGKPPAQSAALSRPHVAGGAVRIGERNSVGAHAVVTEGVVIGDDSLVGDGATIREHCRVGNRCVIGRGVSLHPDCIVGDRTRILDNSHLATATRLGEECFVSVQVTMVSDPALGREPFDADRVRGPVVGDRVAIGAGAILLSGIVVGNDATIGAGALVTRDVLAGAHMRGFPARPLPVDI